MPRDSRHSPYDADFHRVTAELNRASARAVVSRVISLLPVESVADFGCGQGAWLAAWQEAGAGDVTGIDGPYVDRSTLQFSSERFQNRDLAEPIDLARRFDLVQSLEVAEHLPRACAEQFVDSLVRHSDIVLFSAAPPGQGGVGHINEQPYEFWSGLFASRNYVLFDVVRPAIAELGDVQPWYRYNTLLFVARERVGGLPEIVRKAEIREGSSIPDLAPSIYRIRKALVRALPLRVQETCAGVAMRMRDRASAGATIRDCA